MAIEGESVDRVVRLAVWSGPRSISTALMRSWGNRPDTVVVDEPFFANFLARTGVSHPARDEVLATSETDSKKVIDYLLGPLPRGATIFYQKHMTHHLDMTDDLSWLNNLSNLFLIRDPKEIVSSYVKVRANYSISDIGIQQLSNLYEILVKTGSPPPIIDAADLLSDPKRYLRALCEYVNVEFSESMLSWSPGPRESDGPWGVYWYKSLWNSTGFAHPDNRILANLKPSDQQVVDEAMPYYLELHENRLKL